MNEDPEIHKKASKFADMMVKETYARIRQAADAEPVSEYLIQHYVQKIIDVGKGHGNLPEFYAAIKILADGINRADEEVRKDFEKENP